jgi:hypothetical protein
MNEMQKAELRDILLSLTSILYVKEEDILYYEDRISAIIEKAIEETRKER